jgi:serine/threonine-protein kinase
MRGSPVSQVRSAGALPGTGDVIANRYRIERVLGRGGMGVAYAATNLVTDKQVALKWILREHDASRLRRVIREARAAGRIRHPNIVDVYDVGEHEGSLFLVMELLTGQSLQALIAERAPLAVDQFLAWFLPALHGVRAAHRQGVIHRDLKPDNVFLCCDEAGEPLTAKVLDFGVSKILSAEPILEDPGLTDSGTLVGTPSYIAPEQIEDARNADARSDIYACGVILYHALGGKLPFEADNYANLVVKIVTSKPVPLRDLRADLPAELCAAVERAMQPRSQDRFADIDGLMQALAPFAKSGVATAARPAPQRRRWQPAALVLAFAALVAVGLWWAQTVTERPSQPMRAQLQAATPVSAPVPAVDAVAAQQAVAPIAPEPEPAASGAPGHRERTVPAAAGPPSAAESDRGSVARPGSDRAGHPQRSDHRAEHR